MDTLLLLLSIGLLAVFAAEGIICAVKKLRKKPTKTGVISLSALALSAVCLLVFLGLTDSWANALFFLSAIASISAAVLLVVVLIRRIRKKKRWLHWICIAVAVAITISAYHFSNVAWSKRVLAPENYEVTVQTDYDFVVEDGDTPLTVPTDNGFGPKSRYRVVYDVEAYDLLLTKTDATEQDCINAIRGNKNIGRNFQKYFIDFTHRIAEQYPQANLSVLYRNLATLNVVELNRREYLKKSLDVTSAGCYRMDENTIYIPEGTVYKEGEWGFQVLIHEFCHVARISFWKDENGVNERIQFEGKTDSDDRTDRTILMESMNSAFSCSLLNYYEKDIAYQLPSNYLRIMLECMDNYTLSDYINHSDLYFLRKLDEFTGYTNYADVIWKLITLQRYDGQSDKADIPAEAYEPIYDYLCEMYYTKYITPDMDETQRQRVADELVEKAFYDVSENYKINPDYFYTYLDSFVPAS